MPLSLTLAHLYPDYMNIYGDYGNIIVLKQRCAWRNINLKIIPVDIGTVIDWYDCDLAFFGGGQDSGQTLIAEDFLHRQGESLADAIEDGLVVLAICGGYQLLGHYFRTHTGERLPGVGVLDVHTVSGKQRLIGDVVIETDLAGAFQTAAALHTNGYAIPQPPTHLIGFENHSGRTYHGPRVTSLGRVLVGYGDNGEDDVGGAVYRNTVGCYLHGALLPKNSHLADQLLLLALQRRYGSEVSLPPLDDRLELAAHRAMKTRLLG